VRNARMGPVGGERRRRTLFALFSTLLGCALWSHPWAASPPQTQPLRKIALVIGNARYLAVDALKNPGNDAHDMCEKLQEIGFESNCYVDVDTRARLRSVIEDFVDSAPDHAITFVYYAGHAVQLNNENYLIPTSARFTNPQELANQSVNLSFLMGQLSRTKSYVTVIILDACRNNPLASEGQSFTPGLARINEKPQDTAILYASAANEIAMDGEGRNGIFTKHLLAHLHEPGTIEVLFRHVTDGVQQETELLGYKQTPDLYTNIHVTYCLFKCTQLEELQAQVEEAERKKRDAEARAAAGDSEAKHLADAYAAEIIKLKAAEKTAQKTQSNVAVPQVM